MIMIVVVTGGIGSGKSEVCRLLNEYGAARYDADERVKALYAAHPTLLSDISDRLGVDLCDGNGNFVPRILAERIFSDPEALAAVESLVFPALIEDFEAFRRTCRVRVCNGPGKGILQRIRRYDGSGGCTV